MATRDEIHEILDGVELTMKYRQGESGLWIGYCEEVPEARSQGETKEDLKDNLLDAVAFMLEEYTVEELEHLKRSVNSAQRDLLVL